MSQAYQHMSDLVDASLPNTISSGPAIRFQPEAAIDETGLPLEDGVMRHNSLPLSSPHVTAVPPAPSAAYLGVRQLSGLHPLSSLASPNSNNAPPLTDGSAVVPSPSFARSVSGPQPARGASDNLESFSPECRICLLSEPLGDLVSPCLCTGSMAYTHMDCLRTWVMEKRSVRCELCGAMYKEPHGSALASSIPPAPPPPPPTLAAVRRLITPDGQPIYIMPVGVDMGPGGIGPLLQHSAVGPGSTAVIGVADPRELEPQPLCELRNMWSYALILVLLLFAIIYVTVISKRSRQAPWMMTLWQVLLVVLPIYLVLRVAFDLYRHRLAQQLAAANLQAMALANAAASAGQNSTDAGGPREVIITRAGNRLLVLQRAVP